MALWLLILASVGFGLSIAQEPYLGSFMGTLSNKDQGISGHVYSVDENTVYLKNFTFSGTGSVAIFVYAGTLGEDGGYTKTGFPLRNIKGSIQRLSRSNAGENHVLKFPEDKTLFDVDWLGIIDRKNKALYSRVLVDEKVKASIPRILSLDSLKGRNGLSSSEVIILDSRTIVIKNFNFRGRAPDTHFLIGIAGNIPNDIDGYMIPNERGTYEPLGPYDNQTIILSIPPDKPDLHMAKWLSIWSQKIKVSLAHINFPNPKLNVPPSLDTIGVEPKTTLNCELLNHELGLELRWTLSDDDIILQLVANTGSDRYLALGIREISGLKAVSGDVLVGWISSKSGKGGIDDYFLAGDAIQCDDGAESCPDRSKGGSKDIELLNAVSRVNYTMLTIRRPILATGAFDVDVELKKPQNIFWSVGYKSASMRKNHKPVKNLDPITIEFGRNPAWKCPEENDQASQSKPNRGSGSPSIDQPRRRISSPVILTPPAAIKNSTPRPPVTPGGVVFRPVYRSNRPPGPSPTPRPPPSGPSRGPSITPRPATGPPRIRSRLPPAKVASDWFSPPTKPEVTSGFLPNRRSPMPKLIKETLEQKNNNNLLNQDWKMPNIGCSQSSGILYVHLGPATARRGNQGIGPTSDGTAIYINGLLAPELTLQRGKEYTFVVETGLGTDPKGTFQPLYITNDAFGGRQLKTELEAKAERVYSGVTLGRQGSLVPSAMGKLCRWSSPRPVMTYASYPDFHKNLVLKCESEPTSMLALLRSTKVDNPSILKFIPDNTMPDELYYQSFMGKRLGGKIHLTDYCYDSKKVNKDLTTYRPNINKHFSQTPASFPIRPNGGQGVRRRKRPNLNNPDSEVFAPSESRRQPNRRIDYDDDVYDYDVNAFDNQDMDLYYKCKQKALMRGRSLKNNEDMPSFEHFPKRDILKNSGISDNIMPSDEECEIILDERRLTEIVEKEQVFDSLFNSRKKFRNSDQPSVNSAKRSRGTARPSHRSTVMPVTTPFPFTKKKVVKEQPTYMTTTTITTTIRPKSAKATPSWNRNTAMPQTPAPAISYSNFQLGQLGQLDPALLHNGFLFDKRQIEEFEEQRKRKNSKKAYTYTTSRPSFLDQRPSLTSYTTARPHNFQDQRPKLTSPRPPKFETIPIQNYQPKQRDQQQYSMQKSTMSPRLIAIKEKLVTESPKVSYSFTAKPKLTSTTVPTLPPPGGDVPSYLAMLNEAKEKIRQIENNQQQHSSSVMEIGQSPPVLKKIPVYPKSNLKPISVTPLPSKKQSPSMQSSNGSPLSMLSDMFIPNWFRDQQQETNHKLSRPPPLQKSSSKMPILPPPRDFPSFEQSKNQEKFLLKRKSAQQQPRPPQRIPKPKPGGGKFLRNKDRPSNDNFPSRLRPVQFTPIEGGSSGIPYQGNHPRRRLKIPEVRIKKKKGFLEQILSLPERLPRLPYLGSSVSIPSIDPGNSTVTYLSDFNQNNITDLEKDLVLANMALSDEEKEFLRKLTEEPTSVSADLTPSKTSFITSPQMPATVSPIILPTPKVSTADMVPSQSFSQKRILKLPSTLGIGFDPTAIEPESGFKPIHQGQGGGSIPTLAFSVMDGAERPPVNADLYEKDFLQKRQNILNQLLVNQLTQDYESGGDRGVMPVNVPAPVVPYVPSSAKTSSISRTQPKPTSKATSTIIKASNLEKRKLRENESQDSSSLSSATPTSAAASADFNSFSERSDEGQDDYYDYEYDAGYKETDRIDVQTPLVIDPNALVYSQHSAPYGQQFPSYVSDSIHTMVGTLGQDSSSKNFMTNDHVVYGKFPEGANASKNINTFNPNTTTSQDNIAKGQEYYDDDFEYYEDYYLEEDLKELKHKLGIASESGEPKLSFLQLLQNLQGSR